jgi:hypothetical protein
MPNLAALFPSNYEESRARFRLYLGQVQRRWPTARLAQHHLAGDDDLTIDWLQADALEQPERVLLFTTGEHGIETYVGSAMLQLLVDEYLERLEPKTTGLLFVHAINPWGMKHKRRVNRQNIDLNRTFIWSAGAETAAAAAGEKPFDPAYNLDYGKLMSLLNPTRPLRSLLAAEGAFALKLLEGLLRVGPRRLMTVSSIGQYTVPRGIYYGGTGVPEETGVLLELYRQSFERYAQVAHLDVHTGYGPRYQMSVVTSELEPRPSAELRRQFAYPLVVKANAAEFYSIRGDMIDYVYTLWRRQFPERRLFSTTFEFGTRGDTVFTHYRDLRTMVFENQAYQWGASDAARAQIERDFVELFFPGAARWREKAAADMRQATEGILRSEGLLTD